MWQGSLTKLEAYINRLPSTTSWTKFMAECWVSKIRKLSENLRIDRWIWSHLFLELRPRSTDGNIFCLINRLKCTESVAVTWRNDNFRFEEFREPNNRIWLFSSLCRGICTGMLGGMDQEAKKRRKKAIFSWLNFCKSCKDEVLWGHNPFY